MRQADVTLPSLGLVLSPASGTGSRSAPGRALGWGCVRGWRPAVCTEAREAWGPRTDVASAALSQERMFCGQQLHSHAK